MRRRFRLPPGTLPGRSVGRWVVVVLGLSVLVTALSAAAGPFGQTREFHRVYGCEQASGDCFARETGRIVARRTYETTTTSTHSDGLGGTYTTTETTTHHEVTWQRADGSRQSRDTSSGFWAKARPGQPATLRLWHAEVVGVEVMGDAQWFLPSSGGALSGWLYLAFLGLGILLWGLFLGWWDGLFMLAFRTFAWMFLCLVPISLGTDALAYGLPTGGELVVDAVFVLFFSGIAGAMLIGSLERW